LRNCPILLQKINLLRKHVTNDVTLIAGAELGGVALAAATAMESGRNWIIVRNSKKGFIITSNNFLIEKQVFEKIHFREEIRNYGHEDTMLGYDLFQSGIEVFHIDNPLEHTGLEDSRVFIEKTKTALKSLHEITKNMLPGDKVFAEQVYFLKKYRAITQYFPTAVLRIFFNLFQRSIERNLNSGHPSLFLFDLYKLGFYSTLK